MLLKDLAKGRDNNLNLIRMVAASAVLITHCFALYYGSGDAEPLRKSLGMTLGAMSVDFFFVASGFLVTASLIAKNNLREFALARILRIYPGLITAILISTLICGLFFSTLSFGSFLASTKTWVYIIKCSTLVGGAGFQLPGVFESNPYRAAVNGSLWTMPYEVWMYISLGTIWFLFTRVIHARIGTKQVLYVTACGAAALAILHSQNKAFWLIYMFYSGASLKAAQDRIPIKLGFAVAILSVLAATAALSHEAFRVTYLLGAPYLVICAAFAPIQAIKAYNKLPDISYGTYIYAFPVQQGLIATLPSLTLGQYLACSLFMTWILAYLSWILIEKRSLALKDAIVRHLTNG